MTYYSLNDLDKKLEEKYLNYDNGFFIEAGGNDGTSQSNTCYFERHRQWTGLLVEPVPHLAWQCANSRPRSLVYRAALVSPDYPKKTVEMTYCNLMSLVNGAMGTPEKDLEHIRAGERVQNLNSFAFEAEAKTLTQILEEYQVPETKTIDLLSLDVEGYEVEALMGLDFNRYLPKYILAEIRSNNIEPFERVLGSRYDYLDNLSYHDRLYRLKVANIGHQP